MNFYQIIEDHSRWSIQLVEFYSTGDSNLITCMYYSTKFKLTQKTFWSALRKIKLFARLNRDNERCIEGGELNFQLSRLISGEISPKQLVDLIYDLSWQEA